MTTESKTELAFLRVYALIATVLAGAFVTQALTEEKRTTFSEIDVERLNIVGADGKPRLVLSNSERMPMPVVDGKQLYQRTRPPGMIFFNDEGDECGGLTFSGKKQGDKFQAGAGLLFDQFKQDQVVGIQYSDSNGSRSAGLRVWERPDTSILEVAERLQAIEKMEAGPEKEEATKKLREAMERGEFGGQTRVFVGRARDQSAQIVLSDTAGKPRLRISVDAAGNPTLAFLDDTGKPTFTLPPTRE